MITSASEPLKKDERGFPILNDEQRLKLWEARELYNYIRAGSDKAHQIVPQIRRLLGEIHLESYVLDPLGRWSTEAINEELRWKEQCSPRNATSETQIV